VTAAFAGIFQNTEHVVGFADALIVRALSLTDGSKVGAKGGVAKTGKCACQCVCDFVGCGAATNGMRVANESDTARGAWVVDQNFNFADRTIDQYLFFA